MRNLKFGPTAILFHCGQYVPPVNLTHLCQVLGVELVIKPSLGFEGELESSVTPPRAIITINGSHASTRQRFTVAHELGHLMLHSLGRKFRDVYSAATNSREELEANQFAAELLMPQSFMVNVPRSTDPAVVAQHFGVSHDAARRRISELYGANSSI